MRDDDDGRYEEALGEDPQRQGTHGPQTDKYCEPGVTDLEERKQRFLVLWNTARYIFEHFTKYRSGPTEHCVG
jgi:hypothetical protein